MSTATTTIPTRDDIVAAARSIVERVRANAAESDRQGFLVEDSLHAIQDAGLLQIMSPRRYGGWEGTMTSVLDAVSIVAEGCPASAWHIMLSTGNAWQIGSQDEHMQDEIFGEHPGTMISGAIMPNGLARKVPGGWRVNARFAFVSGIQNASWLTFLTFAEGGNGQRGEKLAMYCPATDVVPLGNWDTLGLRGSGSPDVELRDVFIPDDRVSPPADRSVVSAEAEAHATNLYKMPVVFGFPLLIAGTVLGAAKRALELYSQRLRERTERYTERAKSESQAQLIRVATVASEIRAAELLLIEAATRFDEVVERDGAPSLEDRAMMKWNAVSAIDMLRRSVTKLYDAAGGGVIYTNSEFLATFRNVHVASHHAACDVDPAAEMYGRMLIGIDVDERAV